MLILITGCVMAGKSTRLKRYIDECEETYLLFTHKIDVRPKRSLKESIKIEKIKDIYKYIYNHKYIFIDEIQFFNKKDIDDLKELSKKYNVVVAGLDRDYLNKEFETTAKINEFADKVEVLYAWCDICGKDAEMSYRVSDIKERISVDAEYIPLCKDCYNNLTIRR